MAQWDAFYADLEWPDIRRRTNGPGEMVERFDILFLRSSDGIATKMRPAASGDLDVLVLAEVPLGSKAIVDDFVGTSYAPQVESAGGALIHASDVVSGPRLPKVALISRWTDAGGGDDRRRWLPAAAVSAARAGLPVGRQDAYVLEPL